MPQQINRDWEIEVDAAVAKIGSVKGGELKTKTKNTTRDLLGKFPNADKIYLEQIMYSAYCSSLRDNTKITETEKGKLIRIYNAEIRKTIEGYSSNNSKNKTKTYREKQKEQKKQNTTDLDLPTFSEKTDKVTLIFGGTYLIQKISTLQKSPDYPFNLSGFKPVKFYVENDKPYADVEIYGGTGFPPIKLVHNSLTNMPPDWDFNSNEKALEIVDGNRNPVYQFIYKTNSQIIINGIFPFPNGLILAQEHEFTLNPRIPTTFKLKRIFKYPKWKYPGQFDEP